MHVSAHTKSETQKSRVSPTGKRGGDRQGSSNWRCDLKHPPCRFRLVSMHVSAHTKSETTGRVLQVAAPV
jgi:hypothetical protein